MKRLIALLLIALANFGNHKKPKQLEFKFHQQYKSGADFKKNHTVSLTKSKTGKAK